LPGTNQLNLWIPPGKSFVMRIASSNLSWLFKYSMLKIITKKNDYVIEF